MDELERNKEIVRDFIKAVWVRHDLERLPEFWTADCLNHAAGGARGLEALFSYHAGFFAAFDAFSDVTLEVPQQVAEGDWVTTRVIARGRHTGGFMGSAPTGRPIALETVRLDRLEGGRIAEHRSVADMAGLMGQLQGAG